jgi:hypothetical protein
LFWWFGFYSMYNAFHRLTIRSLHFFLLESLRNLSKSLSFCSFVFYRNSASCTAYIVYWECRQKLPAPYMARLASRYCNLIYSNNTFIFQHLYNLLFNLYTTWNNKQIWFHGSGRLNELGSWIT